MTHDEHESERPAVPDGSAASDRTARIVLIVFVAPVLFVAAMFVVGDPIVLLARRLGALSAPIWVQRAIGAVAVLASAAVSFVVLRRFWPKRAR